MQPEHYVKAVSDLLIKDGSQVIQAQLPNFTATVGYQNMYKLGWGMLTLHLFTIVIVIPELNASLFAAAVEQSTTYAMGQKSTLRGFRKKVTVLPLLVVQATDTEAESLASAVPKKQKAIVLPTIVDITNAQTYTYQGKLKRGNKFVGWMRAHLQTIQPPIQKQTIIEDDVTMPY